MGFWCYMLVMSLLIPGAMIGMGRRFQTMPGERNGTSGYRSARSMESPEAWRFAQEYCGRLWSRCGGILLPLSALLFLLETGAGTKSVVILGIAVCLGQLLVLAGTAMATERVLKRHFGEKKGKTP